MISEVRNILTDPHYTTADRLLRLQGWRGTGLDQARRAGLATRIGPATCFVGTAVAAIFQSPLILAALALAALVGAFASNHPSEWVYQAYAKRTGRPMLPASRAARRSGCAMGAVQLSVAAVAFAGGATVLGLVLTLSMTVAAGIFTATNVCLPSMMFTALFGKSRATCPNLPAAAKRESVSQPTAA